MAGTIQVIEAKVQKLSTGVTASFYSSFTHGAIIKNVGYTWQITRGDGSVTVGLGRRPVDDRDEAVTIAKDVAKKTGMTYIEGEAC